MGPALHRLSLPAQMLQRGFWLYIWKVLRPDAPPLYYVGRTRDNSSPHASAPYSRMGQHLGKARTQNALRQQLAARGLRPEDCLRFELYSHGPIYPEIHIEGADSATLMAQHIPFRNQVAVMEKLLCDGMKAGGYEVMNSVGCKWALSNDGAAKWAEAKGAFQTAFPDLK